MKTFKTYKAKLHIPTAEYEFVEIETEGDIDEIKLLLEKFKSKGGLEDKEWRKVLDKYLVEGTMESDEYERMSIGQKSVIQEIKKHYNRYK